MGLEGTNLAESVFVGGGEMATRMRAFDWSATPLGPVEQWSPALRTSVRILLGSGHAMSIHWSPNYITLYNDAARPHMGSKHPAVLGTTSRDTLPEAWEMFEPLFAAVMQGQSFNITNQLVPVDRNNYLEEFYTSCSLSAIPQDDGSPGGVLLVTVDTTELVVEDRRRQLISDLALRTTGTRNEEEVWSAAAKTLGENCLSLPFAFLYEYLPSEYRAVLAGASVEADEALKPPAIDCHCENLWRFDTALTKDGVLVELGDRASRVPVPNWPDTPKQAYVAPIRLGDHREPFGFLVAGLHPGRAFDDAYRQFILRISEQITIGLASARAFEQERKRAVALTEIDRAKTAFFSNVSHEFRTPLTLMLGPLEEVLPEARERLSPDSLELLVAVQRNGVRLLRLVNTLLDFSRIEAGRALASYQPTDLATFTTEIASAFDSVMQSAGLRFSVECQSIPEPAYVDRDMWEKIVLNLLSNAYKFTFDGEVALTLKPVDGAVELRVRDTGVGISEEHRERLFERFHRIEGVPARTYEGSGIGLALVQELVKLHGGGVRVESAIGVGSTFTVTIPSGKAHLQPERVQAAQSLASTRVGVEAYVDEVRLWSEDEIGMAELTAMVGERPSPASPQNAGALEKRELIVLADDNADMRQYLTRLLSERYEVHVTTEGAQALEAVRQLRPALVLADVMMPRLDGFGLLQAIREDPALADVPVVLLSARAGEESRAEGLEADADDYVIKPFAARELLARVATHAKMAKIRRETAEREERLRGEAQLERERLRASEERLAETSRLYDELQRADAELRIQVGLLQQLPVSAWTLKPDGTPDFVNQVWLDFSGQTLDFVRSHPEAWMTAVHPEDRESAARNFWEGVRSGQGFSFETRTLRAKDGIYRRHLQQAVVLRDAEGKVLRFVGTTTDIDDQKRAEETLRQAQSELAHVARVATLNAMTASITHEVSQPLSGILTNANTGLRMLAAEPPNLAGVAETVRRTIRDANRASAVIRRLRDMFSRKEPVTELVDLNSAARDVIAISDGELRRRGARVQTDLADGLPPVSADRVQLQQVILNLLLNAADAMEGIEDRPRSLLVRTELESDGGAVRLEVRDAGTGIDPATVEKLFEPFHTTKANGMGVGLSICRSIIESHKGRLWAAPNDGPGATFSFSIPVVSGPAVAPSPTGGPSSH